MPIERSFDRTDRILRTTIAGSLTFRDIDDHIQAVRRSGAEVCPELIDARHVEGGPLSPQTLLAVASRARDMLASRRFTRRAVVVSSEAHFAMARKFAAFVAGWLRLGVFDNVDDAREWLLQPMAIPRTIGKAEMASWQRSSPPAARPVPPSPAAP